MMREDEASYVHSPLANMPLTSCLLLLLMRSPCCENILLPIESNLFPVVLYTPPIRVYNFPFITLCYLNTPMQYDRTTDVTTCKNACLYMYI